MAPPYTQLALLQKRHLPVQKSLAGLGLSCLGISARPFKHLYRCCDLMAENFQESMIKRTISSIMALKMAWSPEDDIEPVLDL